MPAILRLGDPISCGDRMANGSSSVFANGIPVSRVGIDLTAGHCFTPVPIITGSPNVFANGVPVARTGDSIAVHCCPDHGCHSGVGAGGSPNVNAN